MASNDQVECLWSFVSAIDGELSIEKTAKKDVMKAKSFMDYINEHCQ